MAEGRQMSIVEKLTSRITRAEQVRASEANGADPVAVYAAEATKDAVLASILPGQQLRSVRLDLISPAPDGQARQQFDEERLGALADSLRRSGVREPIIVTPHGAEPGHFQIVAGERRWRAAQLAGLEEIPCIIDPKLVDRPTKLLAQAEENLHRENLNAVEEADVLAQLMGARDLDVREAGELIGRSYAQARRLYRIHMAVEPIKKALIRGELDARGAIEVDRVFNALEKAVGNGEALKRVEKLLERIVLEKWPIRRIEQHAKKVAGGEDEESSASSGLSGEAVTAAPAAVGNRSADTTPDEAAKVVAQEVVAEIEVLPDTPPPLFTREHGRVVIEEARIQRGLVTPDEREQLIAVLEELLMRVRRV
ncbi:ParB/RepB/Spo0J family partition protein [Anaeromyxobacter sp. SG26]|uniref:ParB/RepB/Spo0J family partition protein n=1 Tax=Anaeromyxobacter sp. SG26 TaxID=2925407 RepID=UPI001F59FDE9|nr:ParB/RepB/Spo0J family partition protein [Anaeromyxobacter sp. SG26]